MGIASAAHSTSGLPRRNTTAAPSRGAAAGATTCRSDQKNSIKPNVGANVEFLSASTTDSLVQA